MTVLSVTATVFACHSAACRPPTSGGTGGSGGGGKSGVKWAAGPPSAGGVKPSGGGDESGRVSTTGVASYNPAKKRIEMDGKPITDLVRKAYPDGYQTVMSSRELYSRSADGKLQPRKVVGKTVSEVRVRAEALWLSHLATKMAQ